MPSPKASLSLSSLAMLAVTMLAGAGPALAAGDHQGLGEARRQGARAGQAEHEGRPVLCPAAGRQWTRRSRWARAAG